MSVPNNIILCQFFGAFFFGFFIAVNQVDSSGVNYSPERMEAAPVLWLPANYVFIILMNSDYTSQVQTVQRLHFRDAVFKDQRY